MKEIIAIIRPKQWQKTKNKLMEDGFTAFTVQRCHGRGRQKGLQYLSNNPPQRGIRNDGSPRIHSGVTRHELLAARGIQFLPKRMVTIFAGDEDVQRIIDILIETNFTGEIGDGKIFVCPVESSESIRTGDKSSEVHA